MPWFRMVFKVLRSRKVHKELEESCKNSDWPSFMRCYTDSFQFLSSSIIMLYALRLIDDGELTYASQLITHVKKRKDKWFAKAVSAMGRVCIHLQQWERARKYFEHALKLGETSDETWVGLGRVMFELSSWEEARRAAEKIDAASEYRSEAAFIIGMVRRQEQEYILAARNFEDALSADPFNIEALEAYAWMLAGIEDISAINELFGRCTEQVKCYEVLLLMGNVYSALYLYDSAEDLFAAAVKSEPQTAEGWCWYGVMRRNSGDVDGAIEFLHNAKSIELDSPIILWHLSLCYLLKGQYEIGWKGYSNRRFITTYGDTIRTFNVPEWTGKERAKCLLVYGEQGIGDEIMFATCLRFVGDLVDRIVLECHSKLAALFSYSFPEIQVVGSMQSKNLMALDECCEIDYVVPIGDLPRIYLSNMNWPNTLPPYLKVLQSARSIWRERLDALGGCLKVGISWAGGLKTTRNRLRSIPIKEWTPILSCPEVAFVNLQYGDVGGDLQHMESESGVVIKNWPEVHADFSKMAALVSELDIVISVQTAIVHLAGALGKNVWALISVGPEWRYGVDRPKMDWYQNVILYRQEKLWDWAPVMQSVANDLNSLINNDK